jgi:D-sedoheptulose 7-phosphate isomerase
MTARPAPALAVAITERERVLGAFLEANQDRLARACHDLARAFARGGVLIPFGTGAAATDAAHVAVEFMHPVIVGKRALPALAPTNDPARAARLEVLGRPGDVALSIAHRAGDAKAAAFLAAARRRDMLTIALTTGGDAVADHVLSVPSDDPVIVQEVQETAYHVLWELVHVFFEHPGLLDDACITCGDVAVEAIVVEVEGPRAVVERDGLREEVAAELVADVRPGDRLLCHAGVALERTARGEPPVEEDPSGFLYPFLDARERDVERVLEDVRASTVAKGRDTSALRRAIDLDAVARAGRAVREALGRGGRLLAFGNGGSATDAQDLAADALALGHPAVALVNDAATVTAVANDVGFDNVFARQLIALGSARDVAVAISTSGSSPDIVAGLEEAHRRGMLTVAITGYAGGRVAELGWLDHLLRVDGDYVPRLQEAHATIYHLLLDAVESRS